MNVEDDLERSERYYQRGRLIIRWVIIVLVAGFVFVVVDTASFWVYWSNHPASRSP